MEQHECAVGGFGRASLTVSDECPVGTANCVVPADTVYAMVGHPNVGTYAGFFVSTDYGAKWVGPPSHR